MPRLRHHVNPLRAQYIHTGARAVPLPADAPVEVELGCADARFLFERADAEPDTCFVGIEIRRDLVEDVNQRAAAAGLTNLVAVFANGQTEFDLLFPDERLRRVHVNFPDPWFKRRHQKRRVMNPDLVDVLHGKIAPGGELFFQSDVFDLALDAMAAIEEYGGFENARGEWSFARENPYGARSLREVRCEARALPIWRMIYRRCERPLAPQASAAASSGSETS